MVIDLIVEITNVSDNNRFSIVIESPNTRALVIFRPAVVGAKERACSVQAYSIRTGDATVRRHPRLFYGLGYFIQHRRVHERVNRIELGDDAKARRWLGN